MKPKATSRSTNLAIIGISCLFPGARSLQEYWSLIRNRLDAITGIPGTHWSIRDYFDENPKAPDMTYGKRGGFLSPVDFDPLEFAITPNTLEAIDTSQLLGLYTAKRALEDAGYGNDRAFDHSRTSVILGVTGTLELVVPLGARLGHPKWRRALKAAGIEDGKAEEVINSIADSYVGWQESSFPGLLGNVVAGRIANNLDLGGTNCVVDAACASSLSALHLAEMELVSGKSDLVITGGVDTFNDIFMYMCFSKTPALSPSGDARPFDQACDGTILGEGIGMVVLKRLEDAKRDGDTVYAVIKGVGSSSDGKGAAVFAPQPDGQVRAMREAYERAGISPETVELMEAHGTGTRVGDLTEIASMHRVYGGQKDRIRWCALGSVKSQIGHTKAAAGAAGLIKAVMALHHKVLPPTIKVEQPLEELMESTTPFYINTHMRPWMISKNHPRRAAVSSFGFGGSNFHCILEEADPVKKAIDWEGKVQILAFSAKTAEDMRKTLASWQKPKDWKSLSLEAMESRRSFNHHDPFRLVMVMEEEQSDVEKCMAGALAMLEKHPEKACWNTPEGAFYGSRSHSGAMAVLFPGQGSQYVGMLRDLACQFPEMLEALQEAQDSFERHRTLRSPERLTDYIYPPAAFNEDDRDRAESALRDTRVAQPALGAVNLGAFRVLQHFGVIPAMTAGHSYGELTALCAAEHLSPENMHMLSAVRGSLMGEGTEDRGSMLAVQADLETLEKAVIEMGLNIVIANRNTPTQSVLSGSTGEIEKAAEILTEKGIRNTRLSVSAAFHSPLVAEAQKPFAKALGGITFGKGTAEVFSNTTAQPYPSKSADKGALLAGHLAKPVEFVNEIRAMYQKGARFFVEAGPCSKLTAMVKSILSDSDDFEAVALDSSQGKRRGTTDLARLLASLAASGHCIMLDLWNPVQAEPESSKKRMTVPLCGANYRSPSSRNGKAQPSPAGSNGTTVSEATATAAAATSAAASTPVAPAASAPAAAPPAAIPAHSQPVVSGGAPAGQAMMEILRITQENMRALQGIQEQTARMHQQFLMNQDAALRTFQELSLQQQQIFQTTLGMPAPAIQQSQERLFPAPQASQPCRLSAASAEPSMGAGQLSPVPAQIKAPPSPEVLPPPPPQQHESGSVHDNDAVAAALLDVVAEKTGYPAEMLELDMSLDGDLGIDSIKRVEIFSALRDALPGSHGVKSEQMGSMKTLRDIITLLGSAGTAPSAASPVPAAPPPQTGPPESEALSRVLLDVIAEKTGYPAEMLELSMSLDSDLGIDSIKRVEIFSALRDAIPASKPVKSDQMGAIKTLDDIIKALSGPSVSSTAGDAHPPAAQPCQACSSPVREGVQDIEKLLMRMTLSRKELNGNREKLTLPPGTSLIITDDHSELSKELQRRLSSMGYHVRIAALDNPSALGVLEKLGGAIITAPQEPIDDTFLKNSFRFLQYVAPGLRKAASEGGAIFITISRLDGAFGLMGPGTLHDPLTGGLAGLTKTARHEWPGIECKALDLARSFPSAAEAASHVIEEIFTRGPVETGISPEGRYTVDLAPAPLTSNGKNCPFKEGDVLIVTGGGRGVTAECAIKIARGLSASGKPTFALLGRSPEPHAEPDWLAALSDENAIKKGLMEHSAQKLSPAQLRNAYHGVMANREINGTMKRLLDAGAKAVYRSVDIRSEKDLAAVIDDIRSQAGPIRGLIHGAGVIADRFIVDKTLEEFDHVYDTKVVGLRNLLKVLKNDTLSVMAFFSSSTGRYGRSGQVDYAMANEVLNKLAQHQARLRPSCRVLSFNWGPWDGGMVNSSLKKIFEKEGVGLIPIEPGTEYFLREICSSGTNPIEVVVIGNNGTEDHHPEGAPLSAVFERILSVEENPVMSSHVLDGMAVLPVALIAEWLAHGALTGNPGLHFHGFNELRVLKGLRITADDRLPLQVLAGRAVRKDGFYLVPVELRSQAEKGRETLNARAEIVLASALPAAPARLIDEQELRLAPYAHTRIYDDYLFHGTDLQGIEKITGSSQAGMAAQVKSAPRPARWLSHPLRNSWTADPLVLDSSFQMMILWSIEQYGSPSLPCRIEKYRQYGAFSKSGAEIAIKITGHSQNLARATIEFLDRHGKLTASMENYECIIEPSLKNAFRNNELRREVLLERR